MSSKRNHIKQSSHKTCIKKNTWQSCLMPFIPYISTFLIMWILYCIFFANNLINNEAAICLYMRILLTLLILSGVVLAFRKKLTVEHLIWLCILGGLIMRIGYTFYTPYQVRSHDLGSPTEDSIGHSAYIYYLFQHHTLPPSMSGQFYHPPFFPMLSVLAMRFFSFLYPHADINTLIETSKLVSCFASCCILLLVRSICRELKCKPETTCIAIAIVAFHPNFYLLAGRVNNDATATALMIFSILMLIKWYYSQKFLHLIGMAFGIGLGMMTKLNVAILAFLAGPVMLYVLWQAIQNKTWKKTIAEYLAFLAICAPLGLWYSIRNFKLFGQPFGYVLNFDPYGTSELYRGNLSLAQRFFSFPWAEFGEKTYCDPLTDYNVPLYLLRSSLFGEFSFENMDDIARGMIDMNILLILLSFIGMIAIIWKGKKENICLRYGFGLLWLINMASYFIFNIKYPQSCTMDFRYVIPTVICGSLYLAAFWQQLREYSLEKKDDIRHLAAKCMVWVIPICCSIFAFLSAWMFSNLS